MPFIRHTVRAGRVAIGCALLAAGAFLALPGVPGPGVLVAVGGLALLAEEFEWARRWHERILSATRRLTGRSENG